MTFSTGSLRSATVAVCARDGVDVSGLAAAELLALSGHVAQLRRDADVLMAQLAAEIERRSNTADGGIGLAARQGCRSAGELVARATGGSVAEARRLVVAGGLLAEADAALAQAPEGTGGSAVSGGSPGGEGLAFPQATPPTPISPLTRFRLDLAAAVRGGRIGVDVAALFSEALAGLPDVESTRELFGKALSKAPGMPLHHVRKFVWQAQAFADPLAWEEREERQHVARAVTIRDDADEMVTLTARLTPLAAAPVRAVLDARVRWAMQQRRDNPESDTRSAWQMRADILSDLCRHALDCTQATSGVKTTVVVRMTRAELESGIGVGEVDGTPQPVSAGALRRAAADAEVVPAVLGGGSEVRRCSTGAGSDGSSARNNVWRSWNAMEDARGVTPRPPGARPTTSGGGRETPALPICRTGCCPARAVTIGSTPTGGRFK